MDIQIGDILIMKKSHPCGEKQWKVLRIGADFRLRCLGCNHEIWYLGLKLKRMFAQSLRWKIHRQI